MFNRLKLDVPVDQDYLHILHANIKETAELLSLDKSAVVLLQLAVEEIFSSLCTNRSMEGAKDCTESISFDISRKENLLNIEINYAGLPLNLSFDENYNAESLLYSDSAAGLETFLIKHSVDFFTYKNRGPQGLQFILQKQIYDKPIEESGEIKPAEISSDETITANKRAETDEEIYGVVKLLYHTYGYSYDYKDFYYPERVKNLINDGKVISVIAVTNKMKIAAHAAMTIHSKDSPVAELGTFATHPDCRGRGLIKNLVAELLRLARIRGYTGVFAEAVTNHPFSERACQAFGMKDTALLLGYAPATIKFKAISDHLSQRESFLIHFLQLKEISPEPVILYTHRRYEDIIRKIYSNAGLETIDFSGDELSTYPSHTVMSSVINRVMNTGTINIEEAGEDFKQIFRDELKHLLVQKPDVIFLNINLEKNISNEYYNFLFRNEFFFAGIFPWFPFHHTMVLQKMNNYEIDYERIVTVSPMGDEIKDFVKNDQILNLG